MSALRTGIGGCRSLLKPRAPSVTAASAVQNAVTLDGLDRRLRNIVEHEAVLDFLHRNALRLVRMRSMDFRVACLVETRQRAAPKLLCAHRGHIHEKKPAFDGRSFRARRRRRFRFSGCFDEWLVVVHQDQSLARKAGEAGWAGRAKRREGGGPLPLHDWLTTPQRRQ